MTGWTGITTGGRIPREVRARFALKGDAVMIEGVEVPRNRGKRLSVCVIWRLGEHTISSCARPPC